MEAARSVGMPRVVSRGGDCEAQGQSANDGGTSDLAASSHEPWHTASSLVRAPTRLIVSYRITSHPHCQYPPALLPFCPRCSLQRALFRSLARAIYPDRCSSIHDWMRLSSIAPAAIIVLVALSYFTPCAVSTLANAFACRCPSRVLPANQISTGHVGAGRRC
jgi:hypothetical protein